MAISSTHKDHFFIAVITLMSVFTICFGIYEYRRERAFRCDILNAKLQLNNFNPSDSSIRVTVIDTDGKVISDSENSDVSTMDNHLQRKEVREAIANGSGYDIKRVSGMNGEKYFYSATYFPERGLVVRSSVPYSAPLTDSLRKDFTFFYYTGGILILIGAVMYLRWRLRRSEEEKLRIKRQLTENAAHELKTPAASIEGYLETLVSNPEMPEKMRINFIEKCYTQSKRMSSLLSDMSTLSRLDNSAASTVSVPVDLCALIRRISEETQAEFELKGMELKLEMPDSIFIVGDPSLLYSLVRNVYDNALAYATSANKFDVKALCKGSQILLIFSDNGPGVPEDQLSHIFERFYRLDKGRSRRLGGTGLGLSIVKNIAIQYGGGASASITDGGGLTIEIKLNQKQQ